MFCILVLVELLNFTYVGCVDYDITSVLPCNFPVVVLAFVPVRSAYKILLVEELAQIIARLYIPQLNRNLMDKHPCGAWHIERHQKLHVTLLCGRRCRPCAFSI